VHAALVRFELRLPEVRSLKSKRTVIKTLTSTLRSTFGVAVAEVDHQDLWKRSTLGVALVSSQAGQLDRQVHSLRRFIERVPEVEVLNVGVSHLEDPG
jgi:hypothetical protein